MEMDIYEMTEQKNMELENKNSLVRYYIVDDTKEEGEERLFFFRCNNVDLMEDFDELTREQYIKAIAIK